MASRPDLDAIERRLRLYRRRPLAKAVGELLAYVRELEAERDGLREALARIARGDTGVISGSDVWTQFDMLRARAHAALAAAVPSEPARG